MSNWNADDKIEYFLHFSKAEKICPQVRKMFNICRTLPFAQVVDPEICLKHAMTLVDCFEEARSIYHPCSNQFLKAKECLQKGQSFLSFETCEREVDEYLTCFHPSVSKYSQYEDQFKN